MKQSQLNLTGQSLSFKKPKPAESENLVSDKSESKDNKYYDYVKKHQKDHPWIFYNYQESYKGGVGIYCTLCQDYVDSNQIYLNALQKTFIVKPSVCTKSHTPRDHSL